MGDINLYQYSISPFTEKVRRVLTYKGLSWKPIDCDYADKSNLLAVTGGKWTRVPVVEWNGEVVWNSADIIKWIDRKIPAQRVIPEGSLGLCEIIDHFADNSLFPPIMMLTIPDLLEAVGDAKLKANREALIGMTTAQMRQTHPQSREALTGFARMIDNQLATQEYFLGAEFTMADASLYHPFFFLSLNPANFALIKDFTHLMRWYERVRDLK